jgi:FAD/FMN-containing dehydrogenase
MGSITTNATAKVATLRQQHPEIKVSTESSDEYNELRSTWIGGSTSKPAGIARPTTEEEVAALVSHAAQSGLDISVRTGGHDNRYRAMVDDALVIDMREMKSVEIVEDGEAAVVAGGILGMDLVEQLGQTGHMTAIGNCGTVGYVSCTRSLPALVFRHPGTCVDANVLISQAAWATSGGYGQFQASMGLGADQILGARIVNHLGQIVDADDELLYGIRGAGTAFGVIVSLKIKIYRLTKVGTDSFQLMPLNRC